MDSTLNNILQSLDGKRVTVVGNGCGKKSTVNMMVIGTYSDQQFSHCHVAGDGGSNAVFWHEDVTAIEFSNELPVIKINIE